MKKGIFKRACSALLAALTMASFAACGNGGETDGETTDSGTALQSEEVSAAVKDEIRDIPSTELIKEIKIGWSLGNTLDATGANNLGSETSWGNPKTTKEMIKAVKDAGFNTVRIPTTWGTHMDSENKVDEAWMDRVQEVVDYAYSQDMFVILNVHHEDWHDPYYDNEEAASEKLAALWEQIGTRFADYGERLIFAGLNEPRKRNTPLEWNGGDAEGREVVNHLNAVFVSTVRGLGGNNAKRHLIIPGYAAGSSDAVLKAIILPEGDDKIIVSIHAYLPYNFALGGDLAANEFSTDGGSASEINNLMNTIKTNFTDKGIAAIIDETGARGKANESDRAVWAEYYISKAKEIGVPCVIWDNGAFSGSGENFGLLDRVNCTWRYPEIIEGFMKGLEE